jgi:hypothetical protein
MHLRPALLALVAALTLSLGSATTTRASVVEALDLEALVQESDDVIVARVMSERSHYDERGTIVTDYVMQVERTEKGATVPGAAVTVRKLGGIVDGRGMRIAGEPGFELGERVVLFGKRGGKTYLRPVGMAQGAVRTYEQGGVRYARSSSQGLTLLRKGDKSRTAASAVSAHRKLDDLMNDVRSLVAAQK